MLRKKSKTYAGDNCYIVPISMVVKCSDFAMCLSEHFMDEQVNWKKLSKKEAFEILKNRLRYFGQDKEFHYCEDGDPVDSINKHYPSAKEWVIKNYPYLK